LAAIGLLSGSVQAEQTTSLTQRQVRDPRQLEVILENNATDSETRLAAIEGGTATVTLGANKLLVGNDSSNQTAMAVTGDVTITQDGTNITTALAADTVGTNEMADADHGDVAWSSGVASVEAGATTFQVTSKYPVVGPDATTGLMTLAASVTAGAGATETNTFATAFGAAPVVVCTYTEDPGDVRPIFVTSVTASNFVANITADKNYSYVAIGQRP